MARIYHYTPNYPPAAVAGTPWDTSRVGVYARPLITTRDDMFLAIVEALSGVTGAGWTETAASSGRTRIFTSSGESGNENIILTLQQGQSGDPRFIQMGAAPKVDAAGVPQSPILYGPGNSSVPTSGNNAIDFSTSDFDMDFQILATLDYILISIRRVSTNARYLVFGGLLERVGYNPSVLNLSAGVSAGQYVLIPTSTNPLTQGIRVGDRLVITQEGTAGVAAAEAVHVVEPEATGIRVLSLRNNYATPSRIGVIPNPVFVGHEVNSSLARTLPVSVLSAFLNSPFRFSNFEEPDYEELWRDNTGNSSEFTGGMPIYLQWMNRGSDPPDGNIQSGFGAFSVPEIRTNRFLMAEPLVLLSRPGATYESAGTLGVLPGMFWYPGVPNLFPHDNFLRDRVTPNEDYVPFKSRSTGSEFHAMGPTPGP